jgi:hypothetical protein
MHLTTCPNPIHGVAPLPPETFEAWKARLAPNDSGEDYDLLAAFRAGVTPDANGHWPDTFKKPNHPTFSTESIYATGEDAAKAGHWEGDSFHPPGSQAAPQEPPVVQECPTCESSSRAFTLAGLMYTENEGEWKCNDAWHAEPKQGRQSASDSPEKGFVVTIRCHTQDAFANITSPEALRFQIGHMLDSWGIQEEVDYTLEVERLRK